MTTCAVSNQQPVPAGYSSCWDWVASLPTEREIPVSEQPPKPALGNDSSSVLVGRRFGVLGMPQGGKFNAGDIFQLAQATRKARERLSVVASSTASEIPQSESDRAAMLRSAYAAQKVDRDPHSDGPLSLETTVDPFGLLDDDEYFPTAEEVLLELGFGGPAVGVERVPERFLHPSKMRGVDIDQFFALQQELDETRETGSLGYRGLVGPQSRRPSTIVSLLVERMMRRSVPTATSSFDHPPSVQNAKAEELVPVEQEDNSLVTPTNQILMTLPVTGSRKTSPASSRRSSLRRQECIDIEEQLQAEANASQSISEHETDDDDDDEKPANKQCTVTGAAFVPTVYVTPPPSTIFTRSTSTDAASGHEVDSIIACLQLAAEVYRVQLDAPHSDENHNMADIKEDLRRELDHTDDLLQKLRTRLWNARSSHEPCDAHALRSVLADMVQLLQQQQRLYEQALELTHHEPSPGDDGDTRHDDDDEDVHGAISQDDEGDTSQVVQLPAAWVRGLERRLSSAIRRSVRRELLKAKPSFRKSRHVSTL